MYIVIVVVDAPADVMSVLEQHARAGLGFFGSFDGFIDGALHRSEDGTRLVQFLRWESRAAYDAFMADPRSETLPTTEAALRLVHDGTATMDARGYEIVATS